jgi:hypothetical protein
VKEGLLEGNTLHQENSSILQKLIITSDELKNNIPDVID